jgi:hypothetical protein
VSTGYKITVNFSAKLKIPDISIMYSQYVVSYTFKADKYGNGYNILSFSTVDLYRYVLHMECHSFAYILDSPLQHVQTSHALHEDVLSASL